MTSSLIFWCKIWSWGFFKTWAIQWPTCWNSFSLKPNYVNKEEGFYKGINLSGLTTKTKFKVKIYFTYENNGILEERYVILNGNTSW